MQAIIRGHVQTMAEDPILILTTVAMDARSTISQRQLCTATMTPEIEPGPVTRSALVTNCELLIFQAR